MENSRSVRRRWCIWDQRNSGMRNMVERGPEEEEEEEAAGSRAGAGPPAETDALEPLGS